MGIIIPKAVSGLRVNDFHFSFSAFLSVSFVFMSLGEVLPPERRTIWDPGLNAVNGIPDRTTIFRTLSATPPADGSAGPTVPWCKSLRLSRSTGIPSRSSRPCTSAFRQRTTHSFPATVKIGGGWTRCPPLPGRELKMCMSKKGAVASFIYSYLLYLF